MNRRKIKKAVKKAVKEYGPCLRRLSNEERIETMHKKIFWETVIEALRKDFGADCQGNDFKEVLTKDINDPIRCLSCSARQIIRWIEKYCLK